MIPYSFLSTTHARHHWRQVRKKYKKEHDGEGKMHQNGKESVHACVCTRNGWNGWVFHSKLFCIYTDVCFADIRPPPTHHVPLIPTMSSATIQCCGCNKVFTPIGHSQHISRMQHTNCCTAHDLLHAQSWAQLTRNAASSTPLVSNTELGDVRDIPPGGDDNMDRPVFRGPGSKSPPLCEQDDGMGFMAFSWAFY